MGGVESMLRGGVPAATELDAGERRAIHAASHPAYRPDIDGLRALAVLPVVFNHVGVRGFYGGYVGVDIFFVISGYLITGILARDIAIGRHSIPEFYRRRVLRIFPALFAMLVAVTAVACVAMAPYELVLYARSLAATAFFGSNILFWSESGYFNEASHIKPLLHTWSLAVEEQFYILWPLLLAGVGAAPRRLRVTVLIVTVASFAASLWIVAHHRSFAFYQLPARAWELGLGAMLAVGLVAPPRRRWLAEALAIAGVVAILYAIKTYNERTPFPGAGALLPCAGAALLILTGRSGTIVARIMSTPPALFFGRISYSLYLWDWPVIVFATIGLFLPRTPAVMAGEIALSILLAWASWRFVERPFRGDTSRWRTPRVLLAAAAAMIVALAATWALTASGGLPARFTPTERAIAAWEGGNHNDAFRGGTCFKYRPSQTFDAARCLARTQPAKPSLLILGDSHAAHFWPGFAAQRGKLDVLQATRAGCFAVIDPAGGECARFFREMLTTWLPAHRPDATIIAGRWRDGHLPLIERTLEDPRVRAGHPILFGPIPQYATSLPRLLMFADVRRDPGLPMRALEPAIFRTDRAMRAIAARTGTPYVSLVDLLCASPTRCRTWAAPGQPMQFDYGHLTVPGSIALVRLAMPQIEAAMLQMRKPVVAATGEAR